MKRTLRSILALALLGTLSGCLVMSIYPFYTEKDLTFDPSLLGHWAGKDNTNGGDEGWHFTKLDDKGYLLTTVEGTNATVYEARLFRLKTDMFMDLCVTNRIENQVPAHNLLKVSRIQPTLQLATLKYDWLAELLEKKPKTLRYTIIQEKPGDTDNGQLVLTADTRDLQKFIMKYVADTNAFSSLDEMTKSAE